MPDILIKTPFIMKSKIGLPDAVFTTTNELKQFAVANRLCDNSTSADRAAREVIPQESYYQTKIIKEIKKWAEMGVIDKNAYVWKQQAGQFANTGLPDVALITRTKDGHGQIFFFEIKRPLLGRLTEMQQHMIERLSAAGAVASVAVYPNDVYDVLMEHNAVLIPFAVKKKKGQ